MSRADRRPDLGQDTRDGLGFDCEDERGAFPGDAAIVVGNLDAQFARKARKWEVRYCLAWPKLC